MSGIRLTRVLVYSLTLSVFLIATALTITSLTLNTWIISTPLPSSLSSERITIGLYRQCTTTTTSSSGTPITTHTCTPFPPPNHCQPRGASRGRPSYLPTTSPTFCALWRTSAFAISASLVLQIACLIAFCIILAPYQTSNTSKEQKRHGWKVLLGIMGAVMVMQVAGVGMVGWVFDAPLAGGGFGGAPAWGLGSAWGFAMASWSVILLGMLGLEVGAYLTAGEELEAGERTPLVRGSREESGHP